MHACAPGKLILSGEHSAVYGAPAVAIAVNRHINCAISESNTAGLSWCMPQAGWSGQIGWSELFRLRDYLDQRYQVFEAGQLAAADILEAQHQLALYALAGTLPDGYNGTGVSLEITSELPLGSGMGSSAALSAALTVLGQKYFNGLDAEAGSLFRQVRYCERLCHGRGGLIDAATVSHGAMVRVSDGDVSQLPLQLGRGWFYINSGNPAVGTGECVARVRQQFAGSAVWQQFSAITEQFIQTLQHQQDPVATIRANQRLLEQIGVVPAPVQGFIRAIEQQGGAAKVSGAGAVAGSGGGAVIAYAPGVDLDGLCQAAGYSYMPIEEDRYGARIVD